MSAEAESVQGNASNQTKPDEEKLQKSVVAARKVVELQDTAANLKERAKKAVDPKEKLKLLQEAYDKEVEAFGQSKYAKRLQSGAWQGTVAGGGLGGAVAMGVGTVVGTLVSGLIAVPAVALGSLVGAGVGSIHGPFINFGKNDGKKVTMSEDDTRSAAMKEAERLDDAVEKGASTVPQPPKLEELEAEHGGAGEPVTDFQQVRSGNASRRKPRKLETRSGNEIKTPPERKKPRKLEMRRASETIGNE